MGSKVKNAQGRLLGEIFKLIIETNVCPDTTPREWVTLLVYLHHKGWLYAATDKEGHLHSVACGYRIPAVEDKFTNILPREESGGILYVPFYATRNKKSLTALRILKSYLKGMHEDGGRIPPIDEVAFFRHGRRRDPGERLFRYKVKGGGHHVQKQSA